MTEEIRSNFVKTINVQNQEPRRTPNTRNLKSLKGTSQYNCSTRKEKKNLKTRGGKKKYIMYKETNTMRTDF